MLSPFLVFKAISGSAGAVKSIKKLHTGSLLLVTATSAQYTTLLQASGMLILKSFVQPCNMLGFFFTSFPSPILLPLNVLRLLLAILNASLSILAGVSLSLIYLQWLALVLSVTN